MLGQPLVDERVVRRHQVKDVPVLMDDAAEKQLGLALKRLPQIIVEIRELERIGNHGAQIAQIQPLAGKVVDQRGRFGIA